MRVLVPVPFQEFASLQAINVPTSLYPLWAAGTTYQPGDRVYKDFDEYVAVGESVGVDPAVVAESPVWLRIGTVNVVKPFDEILFDQARNATGTEYMAYNVVADSQITTVAFFGVEARSLTVALDRMELIPRLLTDPEQWEGLPAGLATLNDGILNIPSNFTGFIYGSNRAGVKYVQGAPLRLNVNIQQVSGESVPGAIDVYWRAKDAAGNVLQAASISASLVPPVANNGQWMWTSHQFTIPAVAGNPATFHVGIRVRGPQILSHIMVREIFLEDMSNPAVPMPAQYNMLISSATKTLIDDSNVASWTDYFFTTPEAVTDAIFDELVAYPGTNISLRVEGGAAPTYIGEIVLGRAFELGDLCEGTTVGIQDYSRKERDEWGNPIIVERPFAQRVEYDIAIPTLRVREAQRVLSSVRARPAVYYDGSETADLGTTVYGYYKDFSVALTVGDVSRMSLEVEGLV